MKPKIKYFYDEVTDRRNAQNKEMSRNMYPQRNVITVTKLRKRLAEKVECKKQTNAYSVWLEILKRGEYLTILPTYAMQEDNERKTNGATHYLFKMCGLNTSGSSHGPVTASYKYGNFPSDSVRTGNFLEGPCADPGSVAV